MDRDCSGEDDTDIDVKVDRMSSENDENFWDRCGVNRIGLRRAFLSSFHTLFEGERKWEVVGDPPPRFTTFDVYKLLGLYDKGS